jgi:hypothetical protein
MVWDRRRAGHYEVWYATFTDPGSRRGFWIRYTIDSPFPGHGDATCRVWFASFDPDDPGRNVAINRAYPLTLLQTSNDPFTIRMGDNVLGHGMLRGELTGDAHLVAWDLAFRPSIFTHRHLPRAIYRTDFADTKVLSPNLMVNINGRVAVDDREYVLEAAPGCQTHLWGRKHAHAWAWSHCNAFREDPTACVETLTVRLKRLGVVSPPLTFLSLYLGSDVYHFRRFIDLARTRGRWETGLYRFSGVGRHIKIEGEMRCRPEDLVRAQYVDPDGDPSFCHNTEIGDASLTVWTRRALAAPFIRLCRLTSRGTAHFEYAGRIPDGQVLRKHTPIE